MGAGPRAITNDVRDVGNEEPHISNLELSTTVLLLIDPQNDFLSEGGVMWDVVGEGVKKTKVVEHLVELRNAATTAARFTGEERHVRRLPKTGLGAPEVREQS